MLLFIVRIGIFKKLYSRCHGKTGGNRNLHSSLGVQHNTYQYIKFIYFFYPEYLLLNVSPIEILAKGHTDVCARIFNALFLKTKLLEKWKYQQQSVTPIIK